MRYYGGLDLLRFFSATLVVLSHIAVFGAVTPSWPVDPADAPLGWLEPVGWLGWIGVQLFFVLSGFIISASAANSSASAFLKRRAIRLFPALWLSAALALLARAAWGEPFTELIQSFLRSVILSPQGPYIDGVVWSLVVEAVFYLTVAGTIHVASKWGGLRRCLTMLAFAIGTASTAFTILFWLVAKAELLPGSDALANTLGWFGFDVVLLRHGVFFAVGMLLFQSIDRGMSKNIGAGLLVFGAGCFLQIINQVPSGYSGILPISIWIAATFLSYGSVKYGEKINGEKVRHFLRPLGLMTYPLYLNHFVLGQALLPILALWIPSGIWLFVALTSVLLAIAAFMALGPERWLQQRARNFILPRHVSLQEKGIAVGAVSPAN